MIGTGSRPLQCVEGLPWREACRAVPPRNARTIERASVLEQRRNVASTSRARVAAAECGSARTRDRQARQVWDPALLHSRLGAEMRVLDDAIFVG